MNSPTECYGGPLDGDWIPPGHPPKDGPDGSYVYERVTLFRMQQSSLNPEVQVRVPYAPEIMWRWHPSPEDDGA